MDALIINFAPVLQITDEQFFQLCQINELIRFERNADGTLLLMPLVGGLTSNRNFCRFFVKRCLRRAFLRNATRTPTLLGMCELLRRNPS